MTTTIYATHSATESLPVGNALTVTAPADGNGFVQQEFGDAVIAETAVAAETKTFGPYPVAMRFRIGCNAVSIDFSQAPVTSEASSGGGVGAAAFTDLTDAPAMISAGAVVCGNPEGDAIDFASSVSFDPEFRTMTNEGDDSNGASFVCRSDPGGAENEYHIRIHSEVYPGDADGYVEISMGEGPVNSMTRGLALSYEDGVAVLGLVGGTSLRVNSQTAVASQSVEIPGVGTMVFTHGILTGFTPA